MSIEFWVLIGVMATTLLGYIVALHRGWHRAGNLVAALNLASFGATGYLSPVFVVAIAALLGALWALVLGLRGGRCPDALRFLNYAANVAFTLNLAVILTP